jgi:methyl coenzyme M reductase subunit C
MTRSIPYALVFTFVLGACAGADITSPASGADATFAPVVPAFSVSNGVAAPHTGVTLSVEIPASATILEAGPSRDGNGTCETGGAFRNHGGNLAQSKPHSLCMIESGSVVVAIALPANVVLARSGNTNINFRDVDAYLHMNARTGFTTGYGVLVAESAHGVVVADLSESSRLAPLVSGYALRVLVDGTVRSGTLVW